MLALAAGSLFPSAASAADALTITVTAKADKALRAEGVTVRTTGNAARSGRKLTLPLSAADASALATKGALRLRAGKRSVTLGSPRLELGTRPRVTALLGGRRATVFTLAVAPLTSATGVKLDAHRRAPRVRRRQDDPAATEGQAPARHVRHRRRHRHLRGAARRRPPARAR